MTDDLTKIALLRAGLIATKIQKQLGHKGLTVPAMEAAIECYERSIWQPIESIPRDTWVIVYNELTKHTYPRYLHEGERIGANLTKWRPEVRGPYEDEND